MAQTRSGNITLFTDWMDLGLAPRPSALARRTDPDTSKAAAASVGNGLEPKILEVLDRRGPSTADEIVQALLPAYPPSCKSAISRLKNAGLVEDSGERRPSNRGRLQCVWRLS